MRYDKPASMDEAASALKKSGQQALAGGTDILVRLGRERDWPDGLVDLKSLAELQSLRTDADGLHVGAGLSLATLLASAEIKEFQALRQACMVFAARQIRERATLGGNLANASPAADSVPALIVHAATCKTNLREIPVEDLATGPGQTVLAPGEIIIELHLPKSPENHRTIFHKLAARDAMAIAVVNFAVFLEFEGESVRHARIALGAVAPTVIRARDAEAELIGKALSAESISAAADAAMDESRPIDDIRGSARYRRTMVGRLLAYHLNRIKLAS